MARRGAFIVEYIAGVRQYRGNARMYLAIVYAYLAHLYARNIGYKVAPSLCHSAKGKAEFLLYAHNILPKLQN